MQLFSKVMADPQILADIFVNYDCNLNTLNIYAETVKTVSKIAQSTNVSSKQHIQVKQVALKCLVSIVKSLAEWGNTFYVPPGSVDITSIIVFIFTNSS